MRARATRFWLRVLRMSQQVFPSREEFILAASVSNMIPVGIELVADLETPVSAFCKVADREYSYLLESAETNDAVGRFSLLGLDAHTVIWAQDGVLWERTGDGEPRRRSASSDPAIDVEALLARYRIAEQPGVAGPMAGAVGYLSYDVAHAFEPAAGPLPPDHLGMPQMLFMIPGSQLVFDHRTRRMRLVVNAFLAESDAPEDVYGAACKRLERLLARLRAHAALAPLETRAADSVAIPSSNMTPEAYRTMVGRAKEYILAGDIFQVVLSQRFEAPCDADALQLYRCLRFVNPSPYLFCLRMGPGRALVGSSPEVHVRVTGRELQLRPIAGTRRRGKDPAEDEANASSLLEDPKERAEHVMLVDLARNDAGRVAGFSSVRVDDFMTVERYSHVMHIVSNVRATMLPGRSAFDVLRATFPAGTVSGAPKVRAMQIVSELEPSRRGPYAGAVVFAGLDGNLDSCITLRSILLKDGVAYFQAGAGIVADSTPEGEYEETLNKAGAMLRAISMAQAAASPHENTE